MHIGRKIIKFLIWKYCFLIFLDFGLQEVLLGFLSGKTVIYVTHQVEFLNAADIVVVSSLANACLLFNFITTRLLISNTLSYYLYFLLN